MGRRSRPWSWSPPSLSSWLSAWRRGCHRGKDTLSRTRHGASAASASARSSHGRGPSGPRIDCSWPFPASRTMSPGRARSMAASMASRRSAMTRRSWSRRFPVGLGAARDLVEDRLTVLAARVLVGDDHDPGSLAGDPAHQRALGRVALPGRAEDGDQSPAARGGQRREQVEDGLQRGRAVGEVDDDAERLAGLDSLHPPRHDRDRRRDPRGPRPGRARSPRRARRPRARCGR